MANLCHEANPVFWGGLAYGSRGGFAEGRLMVCLAAQKGIGTFTSHRFIALSCKCLPRIHLRNRNKAFGCQ